MYFAYQDEMVVARHLVARQRVDSYHSLVLLAELPEEVDQKVHQVRMQVHLDMEPQNLFGSSYLKMLLNLLSLETPERVQEGVDFLHCSHQLLVSFLYFVLLRLVLELVQGQCLLGQTDTRKLIGSFRNVSLMYMPRQRKLQFLIVLLFPSRLCFLCTKIVVTLFSKIY